MPYKLSSEANQDLIEIYVYGFLNFGETQAEQYFSELEDCFQLLSETPLICRERTEFSPPVRVHYHGNHLIVYILEDEFVLIIRVLHESMDIKQHL